MLTTACNRLAWLELDLRKLLRLHQQFGAFGLFLSEEKIPECADASVQRRFFKLAFMSDQTPVKVPVSPKRRRHNTNVSSFLLGFFTNTSNEIHPQAFKGSSPPRRVLA